MILVTKPYLPNRETYIKYVNEIFESRWLTNNGPLVVELENKLKAYLQAKHLFFTGNGTIALQIALKCLPKKGEIITTPFSYVATTNSIIWEGFSPVFADINNTDFCIDAAKIEKAITEKTVAIMATHVYGNPCNVEAIQALALKYNIKVIYDAAHAFGTLYNGQSLLNYGDISACSFHATKLFHTIEGGCIVTNDDALAEKIHLMRQFGHIGEEYYSIGVNGKNSEFHAAMGLCNIEDVEQIIAARKTISQLYDAKLVSTIQKPVPLKNTVYNYAYYPVVFSSEAELLKIKEALEENGISARRYFYPSLNNLSFLTTHQICHVSEVVSSKILCLPLYADLALADVERICGIINEIVNK